MRIRLLMIRIYKCPVPLNSFPIINSVSDWASFCVSKDTSLSLSLSLSHNLNIMDIWLIFTFMKMFVQNKCCHLTISKIQTSISSRRMSQPSQEILHIKRLDETRCFINHGMGRGLNPWQISPKLQTTA
ncbi:hypothetical protein OTU49_013107 [Cherax quadricarinatus]|uniref:Uncharacterized protein n=1 Tax=Cherax quadricarinatus TaxID=27406 RepID=A0AAW0VWR9_CHEQU